MSSSSNASVSNRRHKFSTNPWISYVGDCKALDTYLESKSGVGWLVPKFLSALFRGVSQVVFANNPLTGLLLLLALFWTNVTVGIASTICASIGIGTALLMQQHLGQIQAGLTTYNAVLVGCVTASLWTPIYNEPLSVKLWAFMVVGSILSVFITSATANMLASFKPSLPCLTLPFNIVNLLLFTCLMPPLLPTNSNTTTTGIHQLMGVPATHNSSNKLLETLENKQFADFLGDNEFGFGSNSSLTGGAILKGEDLNEIDWIQVLVGVILSVGQVFAVENIFGSILMYVAILVYSPLLCLMSLLGAFIGTMSGLVFTSASSYTTVYSGIWGYNALLSASSVGGFSFVITWLSFCTAIMNVFFTVIVQQGLVLAFSGLRLPVLTLPFVLSTLLFLSVTSSGDQLQRVVKISFPEMHRFDYSENKRDKAFGRRNEEEAPENKELVLKNAEKGGV